MEKIGVAGESHSSDWPAGASRRTVYDYMRHEVCEQGLMDRAGISADTRARSGIRRPSASVSLQFDILQALSAPREAPSNLRQNHRRNQQA